MMLDMHPYAKGYAKIKKSAYNIVIQYNRIDR